MPRHHTPAAALLWTAARRPTSARCRQSETSHMLLCQISDLHVMAGRDLAYGVVDTAACLERCVQCIPRLDPLPDVVIATGDLVDTPDARSYGLLRELLAVLPLPVFLMPGNHDERQALRAAFPDHRYLPREG